MKRGQLYKAAIMDEIADENPDSQMFRMNGYDDCCVGTVERFGMEPLFCYDVDKVMSKLMKGGMTSGEADEFFHYNQLGAWMGEGTPCFITFFKGERK